jgi:hypothetical protein
MILCEQKEERNMIRKITLFVIIILMLSATYTLAGESEKEKAAIIAAEKWLGMIDEEKYVESWKEAAEYFRNAVKKEQWEHSLLSVRKPLGKLINRKIKTKTYKTSVPGAPDGEYVILQFETSFEHKKLGIETVTPMLDKDGKWRVSGYYIK